MALRWFLGAVATQIVGQSAGECSEKKQVKMSSREPEVKIARDGHGGGFQMPLHYPRYTKEDYERMEEWRVDLLLMQYGLACQGSVQEKRAYAMGAFLWPDQL